MTGLLLCTDLDRTLIPNGAQPESPGAREHFRRLTSREEVTLAYASGRHRELIAQAIAEYDLPQPNFVIADVGSTIYRIGPDGWEQWEDWQAHIAPGWGGKSRDEIHRLLARWPQLALQEPEKQSRYKLSYYARPGTDGPGLCIEMNELLRRAGVNANLIWSIDAAAGTGLLDVLPAGASKLHAIEFLMEKLNLSHDSTLFAGDSGNDLDVLLSGIPSVLVANADAEVKLRVDAHRDGALYLARGGYLGMNGNYSAGILEGAAHYWPQADAWLREMN